MQLRQSHTAEIMQQIILPPTGMAITTITRMPMATITRVQSYVGKAVGEAVVRASADEGEDEEMPDDSVVAGKPRLFRSAGDILETSSGLGRVGEGVPVSSASNGYPLHTMATMAITKAFSFILMVIEVCGLLGSLFTFYELFEHGSEQAERTMSAKDGTIRAW